MTKAINHVIAKFGAAFAGLAVIIAALTANSTCFWFSHQSEEPDEIKQLKKI